MNPDHALLGCSLKINFSKSSRFVYVDDPLCQNSLLHIADDLFMLCVMKYGQDCLSAQVMPKCKELIDYMQLKHS